MKENKMKLFIDMDGTIAKWDSVKSIEQLYEQGYFLNRPKTALCDYIIEDLSELQNKYDCYILSSYLGDSLYAKEEKYAWCQKYVPDIPIIVVPYGKSKAEEIMKQFNTDLNSEYVLIDDYTKNLNDWYNHGGTGIKYLNGINHTHQTWTGLTIDSKSEFEYYMNICDRSDKDIETIIRKLQKVYENDDCYKKNLLTKQNVIDYIDYKNQIAKNDCDRIFLVTEKQMNELVMAWENIECITDDIRQYCEININGKYAVKEAQFYSFEKDDCMCCFDNRDGYMFGEEFENSHYALGIMYLESGDIDDLQQMIDKSNEEKNIDEVEYDIDI